MKQGHPRSTWIRVAVTATAVAAIAVGIFAPGLAAGSSGASASVGTQRVLIEGSRTKPLKFVYPKTIVDGEKLEIVNTTVPKQVGPHTFSLVDESLVPKTKSERKSCFTPKHICFTIAEELGVKGEHDPPDRSIVKAGSAGWDTEGNLSDAGDTWLASKKRMPYLEQRVTVDTSGGPTTIHFMCAVHSWMHGSIKVLPAGE